MGINNIFFFCFFFFFFLCGLIDSAAEASAAGDALHPEPEQHGVHLFTGPGSGGRPADAGRRSPAAARPFHLLAVRHRLFVALEMGQGRHT